METDIQKYYRKKSIFLTGGTGFLGKVFIEKTLRCTDVEMMYVLIRPKSGKDILTRIETMFKDPLFDVLSKCKPNFKDSIKPVMGDCSLPCLGLSEEDKIEIMQKVNIVVHVAATVFFNDPLSHAFSVNVKATMDLIDFAKQIPHLEAFVHVSSAFANCTEYHNDEIPYSHKLPMNADEVLTLLDNMGLEKFNEISKNLLGQFPNTYTFTKSLAEEFILRKANELPICVFRPGIITGTYSEPIKGWSDNMYGPTGILRNSAHGVLRMLYLPHDQYTANVVPVDYCANMLMACVWKTAMESKERISKSAPITIYNFVPEKENIMKWRSYQDCIYNDCPTIPMSKMLWVPMLMYIKWKFLFFILNIFIHIIPSYLWDFVSVIAGKPARVAALSKKIVLASSVFDYFLEHDFSFGTENTRQLWHSLTPEEKILFNFDTNKVDWSEYMYSLLWGCRVFLAKDDPETLPEARKLYQRLKVLHQVFCLALYGLTFAVLSYVLYFIFF